MTMPKKRAKENNQISGFLVSRYISNFKKFLIIEYNCLFQIFFKCIQCSNDKNYKHFIGHMILFKCHSFYVHS